MRVGGLSRPSGVMAPPGRNMWVTPSSGAINGSPHAALSLPSRSTLSLLHARLSLSLPHAALTLPSRSTLSLPHVRFSLSLTQYSLSLPHTGFSLSPSRQILSPPHARISLCSNRPPPSHRLLSPITLYSLPFTSDSLSLPHARISLCSSRPPPTLLLSPFTLYSLPLPPHAVASSLMRRSLADASLHSWVSDLHGESSQTVNLSPSLSYLSPHFFILLMLLFSFLHHSHPYVLMTPFALHIFFSSLCFPSVPQSSAFSLSFPSLSVPSHLRLISFLLLP